MRPQLIKRIWHPWTVWECYQHNFFGHITIAMKRDECYRTYATMLGDLDHFERALVKVTSEWRHSCEHNLSNESMNRIAWLGQASLACEHNIPSEMRAGFNLLTEPQQKAANLMAEKYLNLWLKKNEDLLHVST